MKTDYETFLEKYAAKHGISEEEAETHKVVRDCHQMVGNQITDDHGYKPPLDDEDKAC